MSSRPLETEADSRATECLRISLTVCILVYLAYVFTSYRIDETIRMGLAVLLFGSLVLGVTTRRALYAWPLVSLGFLLALLARPLDVPNHHWMMTYLSVAIGLSVLSPGDDRRHVENLCSNARWLLVVLMAYATVQKALSPHFMDGTYIGFEIARGGFAGPVLRQIPSLGEVVATNAELVQQLHTTPPEELGSVTLTPPTPSFKLVTFGFTWSIILMEAWLFFSMWRFPTKLITHLSLIAFVVTLTVLRQEVTFISVVCALGLLACTIDQRVLRSSYTLLAVVLAAAVLKTLNY